MSERSVVMYLGKINNNGSGTLPEKYGVRCDRAVDIKTETHFSTHATVSLLSLARLNGHIWVEYPKIEPFKRFVIKVFHQQSLVA